MHSSTASLLAAVITYIERFVVLGSDAQRVALALWTLHTHALDAAYATPYLTVLSAEKQSGKTRLLEVLGTVVREPWLTVQPTEATLFRKINATQPTLLLDEVDAMFKGASERTEPLRALLNAGNRRGGTVSRCVGEGGNLEVRDFAVFGAKVLSGIDNSKLPDTVRDRSIAIRLRRKTGEPVERWLPQRIESDARDLRDRLEDWAARATEALAEADPNLPDALPDRAAEAWWALFAIADQAGGDWPERARRAAVELSVPDDTEGDSIGVRLLASIREVFGDRDAMASAALLDTLNALEEEPWGAWSDGRGLSGRDLGRLLRPFEIKSRAVRFGAEVAKGFKREQLEDAWARYVPGDSGHTVTSSSTSGILPVTAGGYAGLRNGHPQPVTDAVTDDVTRRDPASEAGCNPVTAESPEAEREWSLYG